MALSRRHFLHLCAHAAPLGAWSIAQAAESNPLPGWPDSPFLQGNYAPIHEETTVEKLPIIGKLPAELNGMFVRNGPNPRFKPKGKYHWFDGDGMLHGVVLQDGHASYRNRYIRTAGWQEEDRAGKAVFGGLLDPPDPLRMLRGNPNKNAANTALGWRKDRLLALWEGGVPYGVRVPSLETIGADNFGKQLTHAHTAHPKVDPETGEWLCFGYQPVAPYAQFSIFDKSGQRTLHRPIDLPRPVMMHDFAITKNYAVFLDLPETFSLQRMMQGGPLLKFEPQHGARIGLVPRAGQGSIRWFTIDPCYVFHTFNAYEANQEVVLHSCRYRTFPEFINTTSGQAPPGSSPQLYRWRLNLTTGSVKEEALDDAAIEFPRVPESRLGRAHQFGYAAIAVGDTFTGFRKYDLTAGKHTTHTFGAGRSGGEGVFVSRTGATAEDDGWLLTFVHDTARSASELVIVPTQDMTAAPVARVQLPTRVPYGFHGIWLPQELWGA